MASHGKSCAKHRETQKHSSPRCRTCENFHLLGGGTASKSSKVLIKSKASVAASRASRAHSQWLQPKKKPRATNENSFALALGTFKIRKSLEPPWFSACCTVLRLSDPARWPLNLSMLSTFRSGIVVISHYLVANLSSESESCIRYNLYVMWSHLQS